MTKTDPGSSILTRDGAIPEPGRLPRPDATIGSPVVGFVPPPMTDARIRGRARLAQTLDGKTRISLSIRDARGWHVLHARADDPPPDDAWLYLRWVQPTEGRCLPTLHAGMTVGLTFRRGHKKCLATTVLAAVDPADPTRLRLAWPDRIQELQRRVFERTSPPADRPIVLRFQPIPYPDGQATPADSGDGIVADISVGGARVKTQADQALCVGATYRCTLESAPSPRSLTVEALLRHQEPASDGGVWVGFQFIGLEHGESNGTTLLELARWVKGLQRRSHRRDR